MQIVTLENQSAPKTACTEHDVQLTTSLR